MLLSTGKGEMREEQTFNNSVHEEEGKGKKEGTSKNILQVFTLRH